MITEKAFVVVKDGKKELAKQEYSKVRFAPNSKDSDDIKAQFAGKSDGELLKAAIDFLKAQDEKTNPTHEALKLVEYAYDLGVRSKIRQGIVAGLAGPDKAIEKAVQDLFKARAAMGRPITIEKAREMVMAE